MSRSTRRLLIWHRCFGTSTALIKWVHAPSAFCEHGAPGSASHYLLFLEEDADRLLEDIWPFGMAMFSNDIVESLNRFLKQAFNEHNARGGDKQKATGQSACGRPASVDSDADAWGECCLGLFYISTSTCTNTMLFAMFFVFPGLP